MITTEGLHLRPLRLDDLDALAAMFADPEVMRFIGGGPRCREDVWSRLLRNHGHWALLGFGLWAAEERATGRLIGQLGFADFHRGLGETFDPYPEAAWLFAADAHGKGLAGEGMAAALAWLDAHRPGRSVCIITPDNAPSLRLAARLGYRASGEASYHDAPVVMLAREG